MFRDSRGVVHTVSSADPLVDLCVFEDAAGGAAEVEHRIALEESTSQVWHGYLPGLAPGTRYGFRVDGPFDPAAGQRYDHSKLLLDPYARAVDGDLVLDDALLVPGRDSAASVPRGVVVHDDFPWAHDRPPATPWSQTVVYELHVRSFTAQHPGVPEQLRGTYAGLAHPAAVEHLLSLGVTAVELMPVHHFVSEPHLLRRGLRNAWGYNTLGYFAPHAGYSASGTRGGQVAEFQTMVRALHRAGLEVLLDVVYNHTGEGDHLGPTLSLRGLDNAEYYRLLPTDRSRYRDYTGTGSTLDIGSPRVLQLVTDSLRHWVTQMHVDGFRFDLAPALARTTHAVDMRSSFLAAVAQDPVLSGVKLIAEPWDVGEGGYQVGAFPGPWAEWNGRYRDTVRDAWRGAAPGVRELAYRLSGSSDLYQPGGRRPSASVNFVTSHDGFTLRDLTTYEHKRNAANGEDGRDGDDHNRSWNCGVEGETDDDAVGVLRRRQARNLLTTLLLSTGVPMLSMGDEVRRTQQGNNNAYCQDGPLTAMPWADDEQGRALTALVRRLLALRREHPVLRQEAFFTGEPVAGGAVKDLTWFTADGSELADDDWFDVDLRTLGMHLDGHGIRTRGPRGEPVTDDSFLLLLHLGDDDVDVVLPGEPWARGWQVEVDTRAEDGWAPATLPADGTLALGARCALLLRAVG